MKNNHQQLPEMEQRPLHEFSHESKRSIQENHKDFPSFISISILGFALHSGAIVLTKLGLASGQLSELNPIFYQIGPIYFAIFGFTLMAAYYGALWVVRMPSSMRQFLAIVLTAVTAFDFFHDAVALSLVQRGGEMIVQFL